MKKLILFTFIIINLSGYSQYRKLGITGGYDDTKLNENTFNVSFQGNGFTTQNKCIEFTLLRCAEVTLENDYAFFIVIDNNDYIKYSTYTTPQHTTTSFNANVFNYNFSNKLGTSNINGNINSYTYGGNTYAISKPSCNNTIMCFTDKPNYNTLIYDASEIYVSLSKKYNVKEREELINKIISIKNSNSLKIESIIESKEDSIEYANIYYRKGVQKINLGDFIGSIDDFNISLSLYPQIKNIHFDLGFSYFNLARYKDAIDNFNICITDNPKDTLSYIFKYRSLLNENLIDEAYLIINEIIKNFSGYPYGYFQRGYIKFARLQYDDAINDFNESLKLLPRDQTAYIFLALCYEGKKDYENAFSHYAMSLNINPENAFAYFYKGKLFGTLEKYQEAIENYSQAININPEYSEAYYFRGLTKLIDNNLNGCADLRVAFKLGYKDAYKLILEYCEK